LGLCPRDGLLAFSASQLTIEADKAAGHDDDGYYGYHEVGHHHGQHDGRARVARDRALAQIVAPAVAGLAT
jgi:hypothetical protein